MSTNLTNYVKKKDYLVCVDSDGCAMDTMDIKHFKCFGPCMVEEWDLFAWEEAILTRWNEINLYTMTRGINRFKGLAIALREIDGAYRSIEGIDTLEKWVEESKELSNPALEKAIKTMEEESSDAVGILKKALSWSTNVNKSIKELPDDAKKAFPGVKEGLAYAHQYADVAIVSSANLQAVLEEWEMYGLLEYVDIVMAQDVGSKAYCIAQMLQKGYAKENVVMTGDAPGDMDAALKNDVFYYPILVRKEKESWDEFKDIAIDKLVSGTYAGEYQQHKTEQFLENLK